MNYSNLGGYAKIPMFGYTDDTIAHHGVSSHNSVAFLQKPFSFTALACKVREVLDAA